jgi:hypothetical protein
MWTKVAQTNTDDMEDVGYVAWSESKYSGTDWLADFYYISSAKKEIDIGKRMKRNHKRPWFFA